MIAVGFFRQYELVLIVFAPAHMPNGYDAIGNAIAVAQYAVLGILPGHISLLTAIDVGVLRVRTNGAWNSIALMGGFAEVDADEVTVLVNKAELGTAIDASSAEAEFQKASAAVAGMEGQPASAEKVKAQQELNAARARMQASKVDS